MIWLAIVANQCGENMRLAANFLNQGIISEQRNRLAVDCDLDGGFTAKHPLIHSARDPDAVGGGHF